MEKRVSRYIKIMTKNKVQEIAEESEVFNFEEKKKG